jgi:hypothetical protein
LFCFRISKIVLNGYLLPDIGESPDLTVLETTSGMPVKMDASLCGARPKTSSERSDAKASISLSGDLS